MLLALFLAAVEPGYIDAGRCRQCHAAQAELFLRTGMGRSISYAIQLKPGQYYHRASERYYRVFERGGRWWMRRHQLDARGRPIHVLERSIDLAIGSGNHAVTFVHRTPRGRLLELPLSWYAASGGYWAMSPGYDRPDHLDFRREVTAECLFCHSAYPSAANRGQPHAIDCQRCHGPGEEHARAPTKTNIVNPARLSRERRLEICLQCHLETASQGITDSLRRLGRDPFSFRPGEPLASYKVFFDHAPGAGYDDKFEINHAGYGMLGARCRPLECVTCHDPHSGRPRTSWRAACQSCHGGPHAREQTDCVSCHMPKRRTDDAIHVIMTDHRIARRPPPGDLLAPKSERRQAYRGPLVAFYPSQIEPLYLAWAWVKQRNFLTEGLKLLEQEASKLENPPVALAVELADGYRAKGELEKAVAWYRRAVAQEPQNVRVLGALGEALLRQGKLVEAIAVLETSNHRLALAIAYGQQGRLADSARLLRQLVADEPDLPMAWLNLGVTLEQMGQQAQAAAAYQEALRIQPDFTEARQYLSRLRRRP